jgi:hypothetical protein
MQLQPDCLAKTATAASRLLRSLTLQIYSRNLSSTRLLRFIAVTHCKLHQWHVTHKTNHHMKQSRNYQQPRPGKPMMSARVYACLSARFMCVLPSHCAMHNTGIKGDSKLFSASNFGHYLAATGFRLCSIFHWRRPRANDSSGWRTQGRRNSKGRRARIRLRLTPPHTEQCGA